MNHNQIELFWIWVTAGYLEKIPTIPGNWSSVQSPPPIPRVVATRNRSQSSGHRMDNLSPTILNELRQVMHPYQDRQR